MVPCDDLTPSPRAGAAAPSLALSRKREREQVTDFLLELRTEEIPARMQARADRRSFAERFATGCRRRRASRRRGRHASSRRAASSSIARDVAAASAGTSDERRGPRADAPEGAIAGFLKSTGLARDAARGTRHAEGALPVCDRDATPGRARRRTFSPT